MYRIITLFILNLLFHHSYSQVSFRNPPTEYYAALINNLQHPDSLFVYEVNSSWGSGIACFISFKDKEIEAGYYLNHNLLYRQLEPRNKMPPDSPNLYRLIFLKNKKESLKSVANKIDSLMIFKLPDEPEIKGCNENSVVDGNYFQFSKITRGKSSFKSYYEIYEKWKECPDIPAYKSFMTLDKLIQSYFPDSEKMLKKVISEFGNRN